MKKIFIGVAASTVVIVSSIFITNAVSNKNVAINNSTNSNTQVVNSTTKELEEKLLNYKITDFISEQEVASLIDNSNVKFSENTSQSDGIRLIYGSFLIDNVSNSFINSISFSVVFDKTASNSDYEFAKKQTDFYDTIKDYSGIGDKAFVGTYNLGQDKVEMYSIVCMKNSYKFSVIYRKGAGLDGNYSEIVDSALKKFISNVEAKI